MDSHAKARSSQSFTTQGLASLAPLREILTGPEHYSSQIGDVVLEVYPASSAAEVDRTTRLGFEVQEIVEIIATLRTNGYNISQVPKDSGWGLRAVIVDPDGRSVELP